MSTRRARTVPGLVAVPMFSLAQYDIEHEPTMKRQEAMQQAAQGIANDPELNPDMKRAQFGRMRRFLDMLEERLETTE